MKPVVQVAVDVINAHRAVSIARDALAGGADWVEVGTPLIKSEGMEVVRQFRSSFPQTTIVADMKTMDTGALETEMAAKAGADIVCLLGASDDSTIVDAVKSARKYGVKIMVDLIGVPHPVKRAHSLEKLGVDYLCIHVGIDQQMRGQHPLRVLTDLVKHTRLPVAVAGGLNSETVAEVLSAGACIIIVGGAITKAKDVTKATAVIKKAVLQKKKIHSELFKKYDMAQLQLAFAKVSTPNISDAMHKQGALQGVRPIMKGFHMVGRALTVRTIDGDWAKPIEAIDKAQRGEVLVVDVNGGSTAVWGELATWSAKLRGLAGVVVDGAVRDYDDLIKIRFPIFSRHIVPNAGEPKGCGEIGAEITCGGQTVQTGDWIIGDDSGVVVVPQEIAQEIANRALDVKEQENRIREEIKEGGSLGSVLKLKKWEKKVG
ncbi:MAG: orotidine 5'-phosphate decarboxylase [Candidatus Thermoplasmatota archaeon]|nr:orotidine 5'-phosphate decarboxylase [Candidatus Thermoplasmatota archaeon]